MHSTERIRRIRASIREQRAPIAALVTTFCAVIFISVSAEQVTGAHVGRFGPVARDLSELEIGQITDLANTSGKTPWLVLGFRTLLVGVAMVTVYLEPNVATEQLHRGRILHLVADDPPLVSQRSRWKVRKTASYAYVPLGGRPREMADEHDLGWPFEVQGSTMRRSSA